MKENEKEEGDQRTGGREKVGERAREERGKEAER